MPRTYRLCKPELLVFSYCAAQAAWFFSAGCQAQASDLARASATALAPALLVVMETAQAWVGQALASVRSREMESRPADLLEMSQG